MVEVERHPDSGGQGEAVHEIEDRKAAAGLSVAEGGQCQGERRAQQQRDHDRRRYVAARGRQMRGVQVDHLVERRQDDEHELGIAGGPFQRDVPQALMLGPDPGQQGEGLRAILDFEQFQPAGGVLAQRLLQLAACRLRQGVGAQVGCAQHIRFLDDQVEAVDIAGAGAGEAEADQEGHQRKGGAADQAELLVEGFALWAVVAPQAVAKFAGEKGADDQHDRLYELHQQATPPRHGIGTSPGRP